ncbi:hypothetical protein DICA3_C20164 [Diutina catenulata]
MEAAFSQFISRFNEFGTVSVQDTVEILKSIGWTEVPEHVVEMVASDGNVDYRAFSYLLELRIHILKELLQPEDEAFH